MKKSIIILGVLISFIACDDIVEVEDISNDIVSILAPTEGAVINSTALTFSWQALEEAENYHIQIATPTFNEALQIVTDTIVSQTSFLTTLDADNYEWRVRAENSGYQTEYTTNSFTIED